MAKGKGIPGLGASRWYVKKWFVELCGSVPPVIVGLVGGYRLHQEPEHAVLAILAIAAAIWLAGASALKVVAAKRQDEQDEPQQVHGGLRGALHVLHAVTANACGMADGGIQKLRVTFHRVVPPESSARHAESIEQITDYVGRGGGGAGRRFSLRAGVTGLAVRSGKPQIAERGSDDLQDYLRELRDTWSYNDGEAAERDHRTFSCFALPVSSRDDRIVGVIYMDSCDRGSFSAKAVQSQILQACSGLGRYVEERY
ncbi:GAF domain-containing protein [Piscinibacter sakaiensis]|uniref:GAF domain-containing protein n=1 Tax=Piscinibacter sakaiensis TaxID=1547922 RepID=A0A0K8P7N0_PISS1|nr:GAF domain-containing protein [Piscinibacter sakaiensis]GAP38646.1 hypothetical protein ISF6_5199 [Piscinibacter sakaiensis]